MKILIIDDNVSIAEMLATTFELEGHDAIISTDGKNGLELIKNGKFDMVILDIAMPDFSGLDVIDDLEKNNMMEEQNIIVLTASSIMDDQLNDLKRKGVKRIMKKPLEPDVLIEILSTL